MGHEELLKEKREEILQIAAKYGAHNVRFFGSVARGEADGAQRPCRHSERSAAE